MFFRRTSILALLFLSVGQLAAQDFEDFFYGKLVDSTTSEPVVFATVRVKAKALGVISNNDGGFKIPREFQFEGDSLVLSSMGYRTKELAFASLDKNDVNTVILQPSVFELSEATVTARKKRLLSGKAKGSLSAEEIVKRAIARIPANYPQKPFALTGYYRDYQFKDKTYSNLNEALIEVMDKGFAVDDYRSIRFGLLDYQSNFEFKRDSFASKPYDYNNWDKVIPDATVGQVQAANELALLFIHDAIRNHNVDAYSYVHKFVEDLVKEHRLKRLKNTTYGNQTVFRIDISKKEMPFEVKGILYVDEDSYAIRKLDYAVYKEKRDESLPSDYKSREKDLLYEILVEYKDHGGQMHLNYISFHNKFKLVRPPEFFIESATLDPNTYEMILTLNKPAVNWLSMKTNDFKVYYKGQRVKVKEVKRVGEIGNIYTLSFLRRGALQKKKLDFLFSKIEDLDKSSLNIIVKKMQDINGNLVAERKVEFIDQFREFFTQKVTAYEREIDTNLHVNKDIL